MDRDITKDFEMELALGNKLAELNELIAAAHATGLRFNLEFIPAQIIRHGSSEPLRKDAANFGPPSLAGSFFSD